MTIITIMLRRQVLSLTSGTRTIYDFLEVSAFVDVILDGDVLDVRTRIVTILEVNPRDPTSMKEVAESLHEEIKAKMSRYGTCISSRDLVHHFTVRGDPMVVMYDFQRDMAEIFQTLHLDAEADIHYKKPDVVLENALRFVRMAPNIMLLVKALSTTPRQGWMSDFALSQFAKNLWQESPERKVSDVATEAIFQYSTARASRYGIIRVSTWWYREDPEGYERLLSALVEVKRISCSWVDSPGEDACTASRA